MKEIATRRRHGQEPLDPADKRIHCVSVRLNGGELGRLDAQRGKRQRGAWIRKALLDRLPRVIPAINLEAWTMLATAVADLNQYQRSINEGKAHEIPTNVLLALREQVQTLRFALISPDSEDDDS